MEKLDLASLIHPTPLDSFYECNLGVHPLFVCRENRGYFEDVLNIGQIDEILTLAETYCNINIQLEHSAKVISNEQFTHFDRSQNINIKTRFDLQRMYDIFISENAHIVIKDFIHVVPSVSKLCRALSESLNCDVIASIRIEHENSVPIPFRVNRNSIFALQVYGESRVEVRENDLKTNIVSSQLQLGDFFYIPPGCEFQSTNMDNASIQLLFAAVDLSWTRFVQFVIKEMNSTNRCMRRSFKYGSLEGHDSRASVFHEIKESVLDGLTLENVQKWTMFEQQQRPLVSSVKMFF